MAAKGSMAKSAVENKIAEAFGFDYIGIFDKKLYVYADDGGEKVQICIALTCPKTPIEMDSAIKISTPAKSTSGAMDWTDSETNTRVEITPEEDQNISVLMAKLGL